MVLLGMSGMLANASFLCSLVSCWSNSLDNALRRHTEKSTPHWFSIYQMMERYLEEQKTPEDTGT